jgi:Zn-dependent peptidase ImmA (M78 family)
MSFDSAAMSPAEKLLWSYGVMAAEHIDLEAIAFDKNARVVHRHLEGCEARLVAHAGKAVISINAASSEGRRRFSLGHEIAHWICDRNTGSFQCAKSDIAPQNAEARSVEAAANGYASQLVLPTYLVDPLIKNRPASLIVADELASTFRASLTASAIKLAKRSAKPCAVVCHSKTGLVWFQRSASLSQDFYIAKQLHHDTEAMTMAFTGKPAVTRPKKGPANLWLSGRDVFRLNVETQSVKLPNGNVLTFIAVL